MAKKLRLYEKLLILVILLDSICAFSQWAPDFLIIGAARCGTTSLYNYLIQHPQILQAKMKEVHFFDLNFYRGLDWYKDQFSERTVEKNIIGEASPLYLFHPQVPERVYNLFPNVKIIILLRNPVERAFSEYLHFKGIWDSHPDFESALLYEITDGFKKIQKAMDGKFVNMREVRKCIHLSRSIYIDQIERWTKFFPSKNIKIVISEDLFNNTKKIVNDIFKFLGLPEFDLANYPQYNNVVDKPPISKECIDFLYEFFEPHNKKLEQYLGRELPWRQQKNNFNRAVLKYQNGAIASYKVS